MLPVAAQVELEQRSMLSVSIMQDGGVYLDKISVTLNELSAAIANKASREKDAGVLLFADRHVSYQQLFRVLDEIREAGVTRISLQAERHE